MMTTRWCLWALERPRKGLKLGATRRTALGLSFGAPLMLATLCSLTTALGCSGDADGDDADADGGVAGTDASDSDEVDDSDGGDGRTNR